jgi:hypothetical protein
MKEFIFCCKNDSKRESISKCKCENLEEAIEYFASQKGLDKESFLEIFKVYEA